MTYVYKPKSRESQAEYSMMLKVVVIILYFALCFAQEHLTCLRTDNILPQPNPQAHQRAVQGPPGKRGPKGQDGSTGSKGQKGQEGLKGSKGQKGERGVTDNGQIDLLQEQLSSLSEQLEALKNQTTQNFELFLDVASNVLLFPPYVYKLVPNLLSWQESRRVCQNWGGDLAVYGVKTLENRKKLIENLSIRSKFWIGASDIASEGNWMWLNGERVDSSTLTWGTGEPNNLGNQDCGSVYVVYPGSPLGTADDTTCSAQHKPLCEKRV